MLPYILNFIENFTENVADINFWCFIKLKDWAFQKKKKDIFLADQVKRSCL